MINHLPLLMFLDLSAWVSTEYWMRLYQSGVITPGGQESVLVLIAIRVIIASFVAIAATVTVRGLRRLLGRGMSAVARRSEDEPRRLKTLHGLLASALSYLVYFIAILLVLFVFGVTTKVLVTLLSLASVLGLAVGFGSQKLVRDVITGLFILGEGQYDVGDWVTIGTVSGRVMEMGLRITRLCDEQGRLYVIANGDITQVYNASRGRVKLPVEVSLKREIPLDRALDTLRHAAAETLETHGVMPGTEDTLSVLVVGMDAAKVTVRLVLWVPVAKKEVIEDAVRRRILAIDQAEEMALA